MKLINFPTEFGKKRIICKNSEELTSMVNTYNGQTACFATVYTSKKVFSIPVIDKVFFDFDGQHSLASIKILHKRFMEEDLKHYMQMSGKGFHMFLFTKSYDEGTDEYRKCVIESIQKKYNLIIDDNKKVSYYLNQDKKIVGDTSRMFRLPNTWNCSAKRYCVPITEEMLEWDIDKIYMYASEPRYNFRVYGTKLIDLHDIEIIEEENNNISIRIELSGNESIKTLLPCTQYILNTIHPTHDQKLAVVSDLRFRLTLGFQTSEEELIQKIEDMIWKNAKWTDLNSITETRRQIKGVIKGIQFGYSCKKKRNDINMCVTNCNLYEK